MGERSFIVSHESHYQCLIEVNAREAAKDSYFAATHFSSVTLDLWEICGWLRICIHLATLGLGAHIATTLRRWSSGTTLLRHEYSNSDVGTAEVVSRRTSMRQQDRQYWRRRLKRSKRSIPSSGFNSALSSLQNRVSHTHFKLQASTFQIPTSTWLAL
jgi:hypothetical protein